jgi:hypothetical protein
MIRSFYGLTRDPFDLRELELLPVPYLALIAFPDIYCQFVIQSPDLYYTDNLAKSTALAELPTWVF